MGWVVKQWRMEALERLLSDDARAAAHAAADAARAAAGRDARRARRAADRMSGQAAAELAALERLGIELHATVRARRVALRSAAMTASEARGAGAPPRGDVPGGSPIAVAGAGAPAAPAGIAASPAAPRRRPPRASLRSSPLGELFRATAPR
jgi:hypothetical protein